MVNTISSYNFWREYGHPYLPQRKSSHRVEGEVTTCNQSIRDFLLLLICRCSALSYCQFWISWLWNFKLGFIIFFCHVLANCLDTNQCYSWVYTSYHFNAMSGKFGKFKERRGIKFLKQYFLKNVCKHGKECEYLHDPEAQKKYKEGSSELCQIFLTP
mgnify:CR=1 FL=1